MPKSFRIPKELVDQMAGMAEKIEEQPVEPEEVFTEPVSEVPAVPIEAAPVPEPEAPAPATPLAQIAESVAAVPAGAVEVAQPVAPSVVQERKPRKPRVELSDSDLADWTSRITAMQQERDQARREVAERQAKKKEQAAAWRTLRRLVEEASKPQNEPVLTDPLAQRVHLAPKKLRDVIEAVLTAHGL